MAIDPTAKNREALFNGFKKIVPSSSPYGQHLEEEERIKQERIAVDEANNLVEQRGPVELPTEVERFTDPLSIPTPIISKESEQGFVNPSVQKPQRSVANAPSSLNPVETYKQGLGAEAEALDQQGDQEASAYQGLTDRYEKLDGQIEDVRTQEQKAFEEFEQQDAETREKIANFELKPTELFAGKATWQKILGGIGMFLGSITPEGARNVASIIDKEIERDINRQKQEFALLKDKRSDATNRYKMKLERLGSEKLATMSMKKDALMATEIHIKKIAAASKGDIARAKTTQGLAAIEMQQQKIQSEMAKEAAKIREAQEAGSVPGYSGTIKDPVAARAFKTAIAEAPQVMNEINNLLDINEKFLGGALSTDARASARQSQNLLLGKLRLAIVGPGTMSETDKEVMEEAIANPATFFTLGSSNKIKLDRLKDAYKNKIEADARAYGLQRVLPQGARKVQ